MSVYIVYFNEMRCRIAGIYKSYTKAKNAVKRSDGLYLDSIDELPVIE